MAWECGPCERTEKPVTVPSPTYMFFCTLFPPLISIYYATKTGVHCSTFSVCSICMDLLDFGILLQILQVLSPSALEEILTCFVMTRLSMTCFCEKISFFSPCLGEFLVCKIDSPPLYLRLILTAKRSAKNVTSNQAASRQPTTSAESRVHTANHASAPQIQRRDSGAD